MAAERSVSLLYGLGLMDWDTVRRPRTDLGDSEKSLGT